MFPLKQVKELIKKQNKSVKCRQNSMSIKFSGTLGGVWWKSLSNVVCVFLIYVWVKKYVEMCVSVFKML